MTHEEAIKILMGYSHTPQERAALETLIPELRESEDERIIKLIRSLLENARNVQSNTSLYKQYDDALAWLEKQKDTSKAIEAVEKIDKYIDEHLANAHDMKDSNPDKKYYRGWDDALGKMSGILQDVYSDEKQKEPTFISDLPPDDKGEPGENGILEKQKESLRDFIDDFPYSDQKEQKPAEPSDEELVRHPPIAYTYPSDASRDEQLKMALLALLNSDLIKVAGNKFTKQDLIDWVEKQQEQKPAKWSEEEKDKLNSIERLIVNANAHGNYLIGDEEAIDLQHFIRSIVKPTTNPAEWSDEDSDNLERVDNYLWMLDAYVGDDCAMPQGKTDKIRGNIQGILSPWLKSLPERLNIQPKQEWSEEDEKIRKTLLDYYEKALDNYTCVEWLNGITYGELCDWLKSLRPQPKVELSEDVKKTLDEVSHILIGLNYKQVAKDYKQAIEKLLYSRPSWKPSEEQMDALAYAIQLLDDGISPKAAKAGEELEHLREQLKELM